MNTARTDIADLARTCLARIAERDPVVQAWSFVNPAQILAQAEALDRVPNPGPLHGMTIGIKDVFLTRDMPTGYNARPYADFAPRIDAAAVAVLRHAGALLVGKTHTVEFAAIGRPAPTRNPHDPACTPGGSSSGSAAAVADGHVAASLGTQTGGSMIRPAAYCGVYAIKPSWGLVCTEGAKPFSPTLDTVGWYARTAQDLARVYAVFDTAPIPAFALAGSRIALCRTPFWDHAEPATLAVLARSRDILERAGAIVTDLELPPPFETLFEIHTTILHNEGAASFLAEARLHGDSLHENMRRLVEDRGPPARARLAHAYDIAASCRAQFDQIAGQYDAILAPSAAGEAPIGLDATGPYIFNALWTLLHVPCVHVPVQRGPRGLPTGITFLGPRFSDAKLLAAAAEFGRLC